ncbi:hypothetical protein [Solimicrobium silvestre]|uniref:Uncharacterized protein n=1 Tax=Solimicrobium silvestre TaxID=2099400 RepID=A0A2S9H1Q1_9BURK|nr:hypothetical protein [Solimicrobium silvestre]PRC93887.1 hypothetical protein S2091_1496 [Solimicrobium silvestre]
MVKYAEIYGDDEVPDSLKVPGVNKQDAWWAIESEADSHAAAASLASLSLTKYRYMIAKQATSEMFSMHGMLLSFYFVLFDLLKSGNDIRHPTPVFRKAICQPSLDRLCEKMQLNPRAATEHMIMADFNVLSEVLKLKIDVMPYFDAINWMLGLDELLERMGMRVFRKQG